MSDSKKTTRRDMIKISTVLAGGACFHSPLEVLLGAIYDGMIAKAHGATTGVSARNYVFIQLPGAPPRWTWDPLTPFESDKNILKNSYLGTRFTGSGSYNGVEYKSVPIKGVNMPWMWQFNIPKYNKNNANATRPMSELMDDMLIMRGLNCGNPAHSPARNLQFVPSGMPYSLNSLSADQNDNPLPYVEMWTIDGVYASQKKKARAKVFPGNNMLQVLIAAFKSSESNSFKNNKAKIDAALAKSTQNFTKFSEELHPGSAIINNAHQSALALLKKDFSKIEADWARLKAKYDHLVTKSCDKNVQLSRLTDNPLGSNIRQQVKLDDLANHFAMTEYILVNGYSSSIAFGVKRNTKFDEHDLGFLDSLYVNTILNRALAACVLGLKDTLKSTPHKNGGNLFNETLIQISAEFGRKPKEDKTGSDHSPEAGSATLISGAIKGREVIGDIKYGSKKSVKYPGTYGETANGLTIGHLANTVADILRAPRPITAVPSLVVENSGVFEATLPPGKIIK